MKSEKDKVKGRSAAISLFALHFTLSTLSVYHYIHMTNKRIFLIILGLSLISHFIFFGHPKQVVFDEVHFGKFISGYYSHEYYFDIHPPLGKLIIAGFGKFFDFKPEFSFAQIGENFPDKKYLALRFLPTLAGALLAPVIFLLALELGLGQWAAATAGALVILDTALLVQSRFILLDAFLLLFGFSALACYFRAVRTKKSSWLVGFAIFSGLAISIKWTGIGFVGLAGIAALWDAIKHKTWTKFFTEAVLFWAIIPGIIYYTVFAVHFALLPKSGAGDAFMSLAFQKSLIGNPNDGAPNVAPLSTFEKFIELNAQMYSSNQHLTATHSYSSPWYSWPLMSRPIYYWVDSTDPAAIARIYFIGNPLIWWGSTIAVIFLIMHIFRTRKSPDRLALLLIIGYFINMLPFIGVQRVLFLYHYMPALVIAILISVYCIEKFHPNPKKAFKIIVVASLISFIFFAPLAYGLKLSPTEYNLRTWLKSWI